VTARERCSIDDIQKPVTSRYKRRRMNATDTKGETPRENRARDEKR